ncbi:hypothetical protein V8J82_11060 [Gymnodinialimonas sp. 2305UL16-5]|uniref:NYN domain-containing protein n=1 Tax=Gymnodinialimonas mytili TaxID=3126503 RepID=UPI0030A5D659
MRIPLILLVLSLACAGGAALLYGLVPTLPLAVAMLAAFAALLLVVKSLVSGSKSKAPHAVIDGSNVMYWNGETPNLDTLREVIAQLRALGYQPGIIFDANAGYKLGGRYLDDRHFARQLTLPADRVLVVPKGEPADPTILAAARDLGAKIITNDRYRDWASAFPEVTETGRLVRGGYRNGQLWLDDTALAGRVGKRPGSGQPKV